MRNVLKTSKRFYGRKTDEDKNNRRDHLAPTKILQIQCLKHMDIPKTVFHQRAIKHFLEHTIPVHPWLLIKDRDDFNYVNKNDSEQYILRMRTCRSTERNFQRVQLRMDNSSLSGIDDLLCDHGKENYGRGCVDKEGEVNGGLVWTFFYFPASDPMRNYGTRDAFWLWISGDD